MANQTDKRIIQELKNNGRASYSELSTALGITPSTLAKRIDKLIKSNTMDVRAMPNPFELGLKASALVTVKADLEKHDDICNKLSKNFKISTILSIIGDYDILCIAHYRTWDQLNEFITNELALMDGVVDYDCYYISETVKRYHHSFGDSKDYKKNVELKALDRELIRHLSIDGRTSNSELAKKLGLHVSTISRRINTLLERNVIKITSQPNPAKFGFDSSAVIVARVNFNKIEAICDTLYPMDEVFLLLTSINKPNLIIGVQGKSSGNIFDLIKEKVLITDGIKAFHTFVRSRIIKSSYSWYLEEPDA
jgi:Lrp/AsnC family transcriptional regulator for asnA, asnC and gidA